MAKKLPFWGQKRKFGIIMSHTICHCENWTPQKYIFAVMITIYNTFEELKVALKDFRVEKAGGFKLSLQTPFSPSSSPSQRELAVPLLDIHYHSMATCPIVGSIIQIRIPSQQWLILVHIYIYMFLKKMFLGAPEQICLIVWFNENDKENHYDWVKKPRTPGFPLLLWRILIQAAMSL